ncbi:efflux RND transporter periplasmic adaptor subunit [bacterium]|nr:efflux RND transporter periplasmic adaptor subunit [bacterium]
MTKKLSGFFVVCILCLSLISLNCAGGDARSENSDKMATASSSDTTETSKEKNENEKKQQKEELIPVETTIAQTGNISSFILLSSNLETERMTDVYSRVQGLVEEIYVEEGDFVRKNQVLMKLEADEYALEEAKARVEFEQEKSRYERSKSMFEKNLLSKEEFEQNKFGLDAKKIIWDQAKLNLDYTKITSPISGVIGERLRRPGDRIQPSDKLFTAINTDEMIAVVHVPEKEIGRIRKGQNAYITSQHLREEQFAAWIKRVSPVVDPASGTFKVTVGIRNPQNRLRPGMFVNTHIITDTHSSTVLIPKTAILYENENLHVFVVRDSIAHKIKLNIGYQDFEKIESLSEIDAGEQVIVVGQAGLKDQTKVKVVAEREIAFVQN